MKFAICNETFQGESFAKVCECAARLGYQGVEIAPFTFGKLANEIGADERKAIVQTAADHGVEIIGLHWLLVLPPGMENRLHINHPDDERRKATLSYYQELIRLCADLGGKVMVHGSPGARNWQEGDLYSETFQRTVDFFRACMSEAQRHGIDICFEPLTHAETNFINRAQDAVELIEAVGHPNLKLHLDAKAMCGGEYFPPDMIIRRYKQHTRHIHANDPNKRGPGMGALDFGQIAAALREIEYDGYVSVEVFDYEPDGETIARESIEYLKRMFTV